MKLSVKSKYGILGLTEICAENGGGLSAKSISQKHNLSEKFLEPALSDLKKSGLLISKPGKNGGCRAAKKPSDISAFDVIDCLEGDYKIAFPDFDESAVKDFIFENVWKKINDDIENQLKLIHF